MIRSNKIRNSARGENCTVNSPVCNNRSETVVLAHSNYGEDGKGMGQKAHDIYSCYACSDCHRWLDESGEDTRDAFHRAMKRTWKRLIDKGVIKIL